MKKIIFVVFSIFLVSAFLLVACSKESEKKTKGKEEAAADNWKPHDKYVKGEKVLLSISPDPNLVAGKPFGYIYFISQPRLKRLKGINWLFMLTTKKLEKK
ncbi:hypothetical protein J6TS2_06130 [Heyndrickxia sporothermodurans]|nr:hypothetical protein J6TS2_06130 [Heyndrickxia sporothermodurans]